MYPLRTAASTSFLPLLLLLATAGCDRPAPTAAALAEPESFDAIAALNGASRRMDISGRVLNSCTGERLQVSGAMTQVSSYKEDMGNGRYHWVQNYSIHGTAVGLTTGDQYIFNEIHNMKENGDLPFDNLFDDTGAYYFTMSFISTMISKGPAPNRLYQWDIRHKLDRSGTVTIHDVWIEPICHG